MSKIITCAVVACTLAASALAQTSRPSTGPSAAMSDTPEQAAARKAIVEYVAKLTTTDEAELKAGFAGTDDEFEDVLLIRQAFNNSARALAAVAKAFPDDVKKQRQSDDASPAGLIRELTQLPIRIETDTASLGYSAQRSYVLVRKEGAWRVTNLIAERDPRGRKMIAMMSKLMEEAANEVEAGKYPTFQDFLAGMRTKQQEASKAMMREMMHNASTQPSTRPSTRASQ